MFTAAAIKAALGAALFGASLGAVAASPLQATTPDRSWLGVKKILVLSQLAPGAADSASLTADGLCERVRAIASAGAPAPVTCTTLGDPRLADGDAAVLVMQAAISDAASPNRLLVFTIRRQNEGGLEPGPAYFGAAPRALPFAKDIERSRLDEAILTSLAGILPWLNQSTTTVQPKRRGN